MSGADHTRIARYVDECVGLNIRERRRRRGWTLEYLAGRIGVSAMALSYYESAVVRISASRLFDIAKALGCMPGDLFPTSRVRGSA